MSDQIETNEVMANGETSDYKSWFDGLDVDLSADFEEIHSLYSAVQSNTGGYAEVQLQGPDPDGAIRVTMPDRSEEKLVLSAGKRDEFLNYLDSLYDLTVEGERAFRLAMEKDD